MKLLATLSLLAALSLVAANFSAPLSAKPCVHPTHVKLVGTIAGHTSLEDAGWVGYATLQLADLPPKLASILDIGDGNGNELINVIFVDGSGSFDIVAHFTISVGPTPGWLVLHEQGTIANGKGCFDGASGDVRIEGPFCFMEDAFAADPQAVMPWISEVHANVYGLKNH